VDRSHVERQTLKMCSIIHPLPEPKMKLPFPHRLWYGPILLMIVWATGLHGQSSLTLDSCYSWARANYPLIRQFDLIDKSKAYNLDNASKGQLPTIFIAGQASYQSDVTVVPIKLPNQEVPIPPKDQVKLYGEISQSINDLFNLDDKSNAVNANAAVERQKIEVELYKLRSQVNQLFFGILLFDAQLEQTNLLKKDIQNTLNTVYPSISNGIAIQSNATMLEAELLKADQKIIELTSGRRAYQEMLSLLIHHPITPETKFVKPLPPTLTNAMQRPELKLYEYQQDAYLQQSKLLHLGNEPRFSVFLQAGIGKPALNVLSIDYDPYYIGGVRLNWNISGHYSYKNDMALLSLQEEMVGHQKETFLFNTNLNISRDNAEIDKWQQLIVTDYDLVAKRESVANTTKIQLDHGTATANDYIENLNATDEARQNLAIHQIMLLQSQVNYQNTTGQ
jgi:outer membrane protein TolC